MSTQSGENEYATEAIRLASSLLPLLDACDKTARDIIRMNMMDCLLPKVRKQQRLPLGQLREAIGVEMALWVQRRPATPDYVASVEYCARERNLRRLC